MPARLTVLQLLPALESGGVERGTLEIAQALVAAGHRALVVSAGGRLVPQLEAAGAEHVCLPVGRKSPLTFRHVYALRRLMRRENVDILHLRSRLPAWVGWYAWRGLPPRERPRLVTTVHGFYSPGRYSRIMTRGERVIAVSESVRDYILRHYPETPPERIRVIPRGVDPVRYPPGYRPPHDWLGAWYRRYPQLTDALVLTLPGRLTRLKGHADLIEIVRKLRAHGVPAAGVIAGGAHPRKRAYVQALERAIEEAGLAGYLVVTGHRDDLREVLAASDYVLSLTQVPESFGRTTLEALAMGRPVIGYAHGGVREQLEAL
ncbi:MAG: glycosyltransferase, partial [Gammaproteobacteria bacterium]